VGIFLEKLLCVLLTNVYCFPMSFGFGSIGENASIDVIRERWRCRWQESLSLADGG